MNYEEAWKTLLEEVQYAAANVQGEDWLSPDQRNTAQACYMSLLETMKEIANGD